MNLVKVLIVSLVTALIAGADPYAKLSFGYLEPLSDGTFEEDFDSTWIPTIELGIPFDQNPEWSIGLEYSYYDTDYSESGDLTAVQANTLNDLTASLGFMTTFAAGATSLDEEIEVHRLMIVLNYEHELDEQFTVLFTGGLGVAMMDQELSITNPGQNLSGSDDDTSYAYQFGVGLGYDLNESFELSGRVRYLGGDELPVGSDDLTSLVFDLSAKFTF